MQRIVPSWVPDAVFYQILPDRFRRGGADWTVDPHRPGDRSTCGGNLAGIRAGIPYLADLQVTALYLTPIFRAASYHKYDTLDYYAIDPAFGSNEEFRGLVSDLHAAGIRIVLDGVFNHCSDRHPFFQDVVNKGRDSEYWNWFSVRGERIEPEPNYARWAGVRSMPEWNHDHPAVVDYLLAVVRHWIEEYGIDGWRLDTTEYLPPDFVRDIYRTAKSISPEIYVLGEVMGLGTPWFRHQALDGVMHYKFWEAMTKFLAEESWDAATFWDSLRAHWYSYPEDANFGSYTLISSHDRPRFLTQCGGNVRRFMLALAFQFTFPGPPALYYGDEIGLQGGHDPDNRRCFPWDENCWDRSLRDKIRCLIRLRRTSRALTRGSIRVIEADGRSLGYERFVDSERTVVGINADHRQAFRLPLPPGRWVDALERAAITGIVEVPPLSFLIAENADSSEGL